MKVVRSPPSRLNEVSDLELRRVRTVLRVFKATELSVRRRKYFQAVRGSRAPRIESLDHSSVGA